MTHAVNGIPAGQLDGVTWQKSRRSNPSGNCVECALLPTGEVAVRRWDAARDFYVVLDGTAAVERDARRLALLGPGDFFGELAALDWGAGYGYARLATVTATSPLRLAAFSPAHLDALIRSAPCAAERSRCRSAGRSTAR